MAAIDRATDPATILQEPHGYEQLLCTYADDVVRDAVAPLRQPRTLGNPIVHTAVTEVLASLHHQTAND